MKKFFAEFKKFALKGNVMDLAVGVIIGGAFSAIVTALTANFIQPLINSIGGAEVGGMIRLPWVNYEAIEGDADAVAALSLNYGAFITAIINFVIIALVLFLLVKGMNKLMSIGKKKEEPAEPTTKTCPFCKTEIAIDAVRCPNCTSELPQEEEEKE